MNFGRAHAQPGPDFATPLLLTSIAKNEDVLLWPKWQYLWLEYQLRVGVESVKQSLPPTLERFYIHTAC